MRIWLLAENWPPRIGGIENYLTGMVRELSKEHQVTVIAPLDSLRQRRDSLRVNPLPQITVIRKRFFYKPLWPSWFPLYISLSAMAQKEKPDVIICGKALVEGRIARLLYRKYNIPYIICTYGMEIATWSKKVRNCNQLKMALSRARAVLYINAKTKEQLLKLGVSEKRLHLLYPGIDIDRLSKKANPDDVLQKYGITKPYVLSVARLVKRKGIDDLIKAVAQFSTTYLTPASPSKGEEMTHTPSPYEGEGKRDEVKLVIVGDGPERQYLQTLAKETTANVKFLGAIPDEELYALYEGANVFALTPKELPGDFEGFGIVYAEAAYFGLPVIGTTTGGVGEAVEHGKTGILVEPGNVQQIHDALNLLLTNPTLAKQYGHVGKARIMNDFMWETTIKNLNNYLLVIPAKAGIQVADVDAGSNPA